MPPLASNSDETVDENEIVKCDVTRKYTEPVQTRQASYEAVIEEGKALWTFQRFFWAIRDINHVPVRHDSPLVAANFPDPDVKPPSPAFLNPASVSPNFVVGSDGPTDEESMKSFLQSIAQRNEWAKYRIADFESEEGRCFPYLYLCNPSTNNSGVTNMKLKVWIQGGAHGNEPAGDQCVMALLGMMDLDQAWTNSLLSTMDIILLPRYNPDGIATFQRNLTSNSDPNRDHIKLESRQTRQIKSMFTAFAPHLAIDMHEYLASPIYGGSYQHASDALFSAAKNLNIYSGIREMSENLFATRILEDMSAKGFRVDSYVKGKQSRAPGSRILFREAGSDANLGRNAMGLTQCIAFLCETRGIGLADQHFRRRTAAGMTMLQSILQTALENVEQIHTAIKDAVDSFGSCESRITVTDHESIIDRTFAMIDSRTGCVLQVPVQFASTTPVVADLTRQIPAMYLIPDTWAGVAHRLKILGLEMQKLDHVYVGTVEAYRISTASFDTTYYEGIVPVRVVTEAYEREIEVPAGSYLISTQQRNAALAFIALEPENVDSYVSCNIIPVKIGDEYPIYRVMR